jgi:hypothetical protein
VKYIVVVFSPLDKRILLLQCTCAIDVTISTGRSLQNYKHHHQREEFTAFVGGFLVIAQSIEKASELN